MLSPSVLVFLTEKPKNKMFFKKAHRWQLSLDCFNLFALQGQYRCIRIWDFLATVKDIWNLLEPSIKKALRKMIQYRIKWKSFPNLENTMDGGNNFKGFWPIFCRLIYADNTSRKLTLWRSSSELATLVVHAGVLGGVFPVVVWAVRVAY